MAFNIEQIIGKQELSAFCRRNHIKKLSLFGSAQKNKLRPDSDIDLLVEFDENSKPGLFDLSRMEIELTDRVGRKVDLRTAEELSRYFREKIIKSAKVQHEAH